MAKSAARALLDFANRPATANNPPTAAVEYPTILRCMAAASPFRAGGTGSPISAKNASDFLASVAEVWNRREPSHIPAMVIPVFMRMAAPL